MKNTITLLVAIGLCFSAANAISQSVSEQDMATLKEMLRASGLEEEHLQGFESMIQLSGEAEQNRKDESLQRSIEDYRNRYADKPDATVRVAGETHKLKVVTCDYKGEIYYIKAKGEPSASRESGSVLQINRGAVPGPQGGYDGGISFDDVHVGLSECSSVEFGGKFYSQECRANWNGKENTTLKIDLQCT